jgi:hypothetical protein
MDFIMLMNRAPALMRALVRNFRRKLSVTGGRTSDLKSLVADLCCLLKSINTAVSYDLSSL